jgi:hypothetical protein
LEEIIGRIAPVGLQLQAPYGGKVPGKFRAGACGCGARKQGYVADSPAFTKRESGAQLRLRGTAQTAT